MQKLCQISKQDFFKKYGIFKKILNIRDIFDIKKAGLLPALKFYFIYSNFHEAATRMHFSSFPFEVSLPEYGLSRLRDSVNQKDFPGIAVHVSL